MPRDLYHFPDVVIPFRFIVAPLYKQAVLFRNDMGFYQHECKIAYSEEHLLGYDFRGGNGRPPNNGWEIWWLDRMWPCSTHEDIDRMNRMWWRLRATGADDIRRWYT